MGDLRVSAPHEVGIFKYVIGHNKNGEAGPLEVYIKECQLNVYPTGEKDIVEVVTKYLTSYKGRERWVKSNEIFDTKEDVLSHIEYLNKRSIKI